MYMYYFKGKRLIYEVSLYSELKYVLWGGFAFTAVLF